jgi:hypothetical protein
MYKIMLGMPKVIKIVQIQIWYILERNLGE